MVMQAEPVYGAWKQVTESIGYKPRVIYLTPQGKVFQQSMVEDIAREQDLVFLCGHYEGIDERVLEEVQPWPQAIPLLATVMGKEPVPASTT